MTMRMLTYDGQSFLLGGKRIWLVSGTIDYARVPRAQWRERLTAAKRAGLNCIATTCVWSLHEPRPGVFNFEDELDVAAFLELAHELDLYCILRAGPYVGGDYDLGGIPPWVSALPDVKLRTDDPTFMEPVSRYLLELLSPLAQYQATLDDHQPLVLVQSEDRYFYDDPEMAESYLGQLARLIREAGIGVPIVGSHNLWNTVEGQVDGWVGREALLATMRQLHAVRAGTPRLVIELPTGTPDTWGAEHHTPMPADELLHDMAQVLSGGGQFNLHPFHGGTNFGFIAGRRCDAAADESFITTGYDCGAPLSEAGLKTQNYYFVRRLATFASSFGRVFASFDPQSLSAVVDPGLFTDEEAEYVPTDPVVVQAAGGQGSVVFVFGSLTRRKGASPQQTTVLLPGGISLPVTLPGQSVAWCLCDVKIGGRAVVDYTNLCAFTAFGTVLVLFGQPNSEGIISINGGEYHLQVPEGNEPYITEYEGITLVVCNPEITDASLLHDNKLYIGVYDINTDGEPLRKSGFTDVKVVSAKGEVITVESDTVSQPRSRSQQLKNWSVAGGDEIVTGEYVRFAAIDGPASLTACGTPYGYGYYKVELDVSGPGIKFLCLPGSGDRLAMYVDGKLKTVLGAGPGAIGSILQSPGISAKSTLVFLADNLGRFSEMERLGDCRGLVDHLYEVAPLELPEHTCNESEGVDPGELISPLYYYSKGELTDYRRVSWRINHRRKSKLLIKVDNSDYSFVLVINDTPVAVHTGQCSAAEFNYLAGPDVLRRGVNTVELAPFDDYDEVARELSSLTSVYEVTRTLSENAEWSFAKWEIPGEDNFQPVQARDSFKTIRPAWYKTTFNMKKTDLPVWLDVGKLGKGQIYLNGHNLGRYFAHTHEGKKVPPGLAALLPSAYIDFKGENELVIFDEYGFSPFSARLVCRSAPPRC